MMFTVSYVKKTPENSVRWGWRVMCNGSDICGATSEQVARETAAAMNAYRAVVP